MKAREQRAWRSLTLRPYGSSLCTPGARAWLLAATLAVLIMAASEGWAWGYIAYWFNTGAWRYVIAGAVGLAVFLMIAIIDSQFLTFDLHPKRYDIALEPQTSASQSQSMWKRIWRAILWIWNSPVPGFIVRIGMVAASLAISSKFVASAVLSSDVTAQLERERVAVIEAKATALAAPYDAEMANVQKQIRELQQERTQEAAGVGPSGVPGRGPAVETLEMQINELEAQKTAIRQRKDIAIANYRRTADAAAVAEGRRDQGGLQERSAALGRLTSSPGYRESQIPIQGYLVGVFLTIVLLKLFQRKSVSIYFSEQLQDAHDQYLDGAFDGWAPAGARSTDERRMRPLEFEEWYRQTHKPRMQALALQTELSRVEEQQKKLGDTLSDRATKAKNELAPFETKLAEAEKELSDCADNIADIRAELDSLEKAINTTTTWIADLDTNLKEWNEQNTTAQAVGADIYFGALRNALHSRSSYVEQLGRMQKERTDSNTRLQLLNADQRRLTDEHKRRQEELEAKRKYLDQTEQIRNAARMDELRQIDELRRRFDPLK